MRVNLSHLREHKFRHNFLDTINPLCSCSLETESTNHYLLRCPHYSHTRKTLTDNLTGIIGSISNFSDKQLVELLLYGNVKFNIDLNTSILENTITLLKTTQRFDIPLLHIFLVSVPISLSPHQLL